MSRIRDVAHADLSTTYLEFASPYRGVAKGLEASDNINAPGPILELPDIVGAARVQLRA